MASALRFLHIIVPQSAGDHTKVSLQFQEMLLSLRNTVTGERIAFEYFGIEQFTYFYITVPAHLKETVEGLVYANFSEAEIHETSDYTDAFDASKGAIAGVELTLRQRDVYPIRTFEQFEEDAQARLFSVISKISKGEQVWVQIIVEPKDDSGIYHFRRSWRYRFAKLKKFFSIRDRLRKEGRSGIEKRRDEIASVKEKDKPFRVSIRAAYIAVR